MVQGKSNVYFAPGLMTLKQSDLVCNAFSLNLKTRSKPVTRLLSDCSLRCSPRPGETMSADGVLHLFARVA